MDFSRLISGFVKINTWTSLLLLHGFVKIDTLIALCSYKDLSKLFYAFLAHCKNKIKLKFYNNFNAC